MKVCPTCQQTYADESLNFCLNDGAVLIKQGAPSTPQETVFMNQPISTAPNNQSFHQSNAPQQNWGIGMTAAAPPKPKSKTWLWVLGIFGAIIVLCGGGFAGLIAIVANQDNKNTYGANTNYVNTNNVKPNNLLTDNLSGWKMPNDNLGITSYDNNEFFMTSKPGGYFFVLVSSNKNFRTDNATTRVTVRNTTGAFTDLGFGLMVHNNSAAALAQDYAFLIDTVSQSYRVVKHQARKETVVVKWNVDRAIKNGTQPNLIEVKDENGKMSFSVNGKLLTTVQDSDGIKSGVAGLYAGGAIPIAFSNLQVER